MFRARRLLLPLAALAVALAFSNARGAFDPQRIQNLVAMVDYSRPPDFKVGTWVNYDVQMGSARGENDHLTSMLLIPGEERFWGDDGFWVETWTEIQPGAVIAAASLMSYAIYRDSFPYPRMQYYMRKTAGGEDESGKLEETIVGRTITGARVRKQLTTKNDFVSDTVGADTVITPAGTFHCVKVRLQRGTGATQDTKDSTIYSETRETRYEYYTTDVPMTHLAREDIEWTAQRRAWRIGQSQEGAPFQLLERSWLTSRVISHGEGGYKSRVLPESRQKSLKQWFPAEYGGARAATTKPAAKTSKTSSGSATKKR